MNATAEILVLSPTDSRQVEIQLDEGHNTLWAYMRPSSRPCFTHKLLSELAAFVELAQSGSHTRRHATNAKIQYAVVASKIPGVFNLGGDLDLFHKAIVERDRATLLHYGKQCIDVLYPWSQNCHSAVTTISLVQGDALGGGFECALASSVLIAEESARMGFPEILFNLFPGMGAYSFLKRKVGRRQAEELILGGSMYSARELHEMGVVDVLAADGCGEAAVRSYIHKHAKGANGRKAIEQIRLRIDPIAYEELLSITQIWADTALKLDARDLRMMDRLHKAQGRRIFKEERIQPQIIQMAS